MKKKIITTLLLGCMLSAYADIQYEVLTAPPAPPAPPGGVLTAPPAPPAPPGGVLTAPPPPPAPPVAGNTVTQMTSNGVPVPSQVQMALITNAYGNPQVQIDSGAPATLTVYDQNHNVAFTNQLNAGRTIVDQGGSVFTMTQNVYVGAPQSNS